MPRHPDNDDITQDENARSETLTLARVWQDWELNIAAIALFGFILLLSAQVISRYVFNAPISWVQEVAAMMLIWMTFIAAAWLVRKDQHIRVELLDELCSPSLRRSLYTIYDLISIAFLIVLAVGGYQLVGEMKFSRTPALQIRYAYIVSIVPAMAILMAIYFAVIIVRRFRPTVSGNGGGE